MLRQSIYIVEDEIITAKSIAKNLKAIGYRIAGIATNSDKAINEIVNIRPDLILIDILLKKSQIDGINLVKKIQERFNIPIIYLTAHSDEATLERAKKTKPFGYILKPYSRKDLQINIKMALYKHRQELQISEREKLLSKILSSTIDSVIATEENNQVTYMNPAAAELTGWNIDRALGKKATDIVKLIDGRNNKVLSESIKQVLETGKVIYLDERAILITKNDRRPKTKDSISPIINPTKQQVIGATLILTPINASLQLDSATASMATKLNELSINLIDLLLHELRAPLTVILSSSESLRLYRQKWTAEKQNNSFNKIQTAINQMTQLLDDVTIWQQAETGKLSLQLERINIISFCQTILSDLQLTNGANHQLQFTSQTNQPMVYLDPTLLKYALKNLLLNAIKYSPVGSLVNLHLTEQTDLLILQIKDQGIGIPTQDLPSLFAPFYRASNVDKIPGRGLGLFIAKTCLAIQQGTITVDSQLNQGTTFTLTLPKKLAN